MRRILLMSLAILLSGCGQKGPLFIPEPKSAVKPPLVTPPPRTQPENPLGDPPATR